MGWSCVLCGWQSLHQRELPAAAFGSQEQHRGGTLHTNKNMVDRNASHGVWRGWELHGLRYVLRTHTHTHTHIHTHTGIALASLVSPLGAVTVIANAVLSRVILKVLYVYVCMYVCMYICMVCVRACLHTHTHMCVCVCVLSLVILKVLKSRTHTHTHTHTPLYIESR